MVIDRVYQKDMLTFLLNDYPDFENSKDHFKKLQDEDLKKYVGNVIYLERHGLVENGAKLAISLDGYVSVSVRPFPEITEKGIDFLMDDGGLGAILKVQTVKIHPETIKEIIEARVLQSSLSQEKKNSFLDHLKELPEEAAKNLLDKLLDKGIQILLSGASATLLSM